MHLGLPNASLDFVPQNGPTLHSRVKVSTDEIRYHMHNGQKDGVTAMSHERIFSIENGKAKGALTLLDQWPMTDAHVPNRKALFFFPVLSCNFQHVSITRLDTPRNILGRVKLLVLYAPAFSGSTV